MLSIITSAALGAMVGLIRQWNEQTAEAQVAEFAGVRTFTFWSVLGCVAAFLSEGYSPAILPVVLAAAGLNFIVGRYRSADVSAGGSTTFVATLLTVLVGALVNWGHHKEAVLICALTVVVLGLKRPIHAWTRNFTEVDIRVTLQFIAVTGVILPLVPDQAFGPFGAFNPRSTWRMVVLISGIGFTGYVLMRLLKSGAGIFLISLLGGLASSTAATLAFSRRSREDPKHSVAYALAVVVACTVMLPRVLVTTSFLSRELSGRLLLPFAIMALPGIAYAGWTLWRMRAQQGRSDDAPAIGNPLSLMTAIKFALLYGGISFLVKAAAQLGYLQQGLLPLAFVSGLTDLDAISLSVAGSHRDAAIELTLAARAILTAAISNTILKTGLAVTLGSPALRRQLLVVMILTVAGGVVGFVLVGA
jgi:uncharacterized membrane protein (DUF4010 family)